MGYNIIKPSTISFLTTYKCTASCKNCCFKCNPSQTARLTLEQMKDYLDKSLFYYSDSIKVMVLTGGECFLLGDDLYSIINYAYSKGLIVRVVTNGFWASTIGNANKVIGRLKNAGLAEINFSTGDDHQEWVPYDNIVYGAIAYTEHDLTCVINVETHDESKFISQSFFDDIRLKDYLDIKKKKHIIIKNGVWIPFVKNSRIKYDNIVLDNKEIKGCSTLFNTIAINPYSNLLACCGLTCEYIPCFRLGNVDNHNIKELYERQFKDFIKIWLYTDGPVQILQYIYKKRGLDYSLKGHMCDICSEIFKDPENMQYLYDNCNDIASSVLIKYNLLFRSQQKKI